jgi:hypothetical protein
MKKNFAREIKYYKREIVFLSSFFFLRGYGESNPYPGYPGKGVLSEKSNLVTSMIRNFFSAIIAIVIGRIAPP